jgi:integrase
LRIERAVEETKQHGLRIKGPKTERGKRTITIDDDLSALLVKQIERLKWAGIPDSATVDLSLVTLPDDALLFPSPMTGGTFSFTKLRRPRNVTKEFDRKAKALGFDCRFHDIRFVPKADIREMTYQKKTASRRPLVLWRLHQRALHLSRH